MKLLVFIASISLIFRYEAFYTKYRTGKGSFFRPSLGYITHGYHGKTGENTHITTNIPYISCKSKEERHIAIKALQDSQTKDQSPNKSEEDTDEDSFLLDSPLFSQEAPTDLFKCEGISTKHKELELKKLRDELKAFDPDASLRELYIKGHGPGGQKINKSTICVQLVYSSNTVDKKVVIRCKKHRQLLLNRIEATTILLNKLKDSQRKQRMDILAEEGKADRRILKLSEGDKRRKRIFKEIRSLKKMRRKVMPSDFD